MVKIVQRKDFALANEPDLQVWAIDQRDQSADNGLAAAP